VEAVILQTPAVVVDPLLLLMHEPNDWVYHPFDDNYLADAMNKALDAELSASGPFSQIRFVPPSSTGLSRWRLEWERWGKEPETYTADRGVTTVTGLREGIPADVLEVIHRLSRRTLEVTNPNARLHKKGK
jgi:hypothetical protein